MLPLRGEHPLARHEKGEVDLALDARLVVADGYAVEDDPAVGSGVVAQSLEDNPRVSTRRAIAIYRRLRLGLEGRSIGEPKPTTCRHPQYGQRVA